MATTIYQPQNPYFGATEDGDTVETRYRIWHSRNADMYYYPVTSPEQAASRIEQLADADLRDPRVSMNAFGLEEKVDGEWEEWYSEDGDDIDSAFDDA